MCGGRTLDRPLFPDKLYYYLCYTPRPHHASSPQTNSLVCRLLPRTSLSLHNHLLRSSPTAPCESGNRRTRPPITSRLFPAKLLRAPCLLPHAGSSASPHSGHATTIRSAEIHPRLQIPQRVPIPPDCISSPVGKELLRSHPSRFGFARGHCLLHLVESGSQAALLVASGIPLFRFRDHSLDDPSRPRFAMVSSLAPKPASLKTGHYTTVAVHLCGSCLCSGRTLDRRLSPVWPARAVATIQPASLKTGHYTTVPMRFCGGCLCSGRSLDRRLSSAPQSAGSDRQFTVPREEAAKTNLPV